MYGTAVANGREPGETPTTQIHRRGGLVRQRHRGGAAAFRIATERDRRRARFGTRDGHHGVRADEQGHGDHHRGPDLPRLRPPGARAGRPARGALQARHRARTPLRRLMPALLLRRQRVRGRDPRVRRRALRVHPARGADARDHRRRRPYEERARRDLPI